MSNIKVNTKEIGPSEIEIEGEIPAADFDAYRPKAIKSLGADVEIQGFRKGHVPEKVLADKLGEDRILLEMAELALQGNYPTIIIDNKIEAIGRPEINITKLAPGNPLGFKIKTAIIPHFTLPDYKKIAKEVMGEKEEATKVEEKEVEAVIEDIRHRLAHSHDNPDEPVTHDHENLPEITPEIAKSLGADSLEDLKKKIEKNLTEEKELKNKEKKRLKTLEKIAEASKIPLPQVLIDSEKSKMMAELRGQIESVGLKFEDYLAHLKKSEEDLQKDWDGEARRRGSFALVLAELAKAEKLEAPEEKVKQEIEHLKKHYPQAGEDRLTAYVKDYLTSEEVFKFLEEQGKK